MSIAVSKKVFDLSRFDEPEKKKSALSPFYFLDRIQFSSLVFSLTQPFQLAVIKSHLTFESENLFR